MSKRNNRSGKYSKKAGKYYSQTGSTPIRQKKVFWILISSVIALILIGIGLFFLFRNREEATPAESTPSTSLPVETTEKNPTKTTEQTLPASTQPVQTTQPTVETTEEPTVPTTEPITPPPVAPTDPPIILPTVPAKIILELPYEISGTTLVIQRVASYNGTYLEDGMDTYVSDVAMALVYNAGSQAIEYVDFSMKYDDKVLEFTASAIPSGAYAVVQEINKNTCASGDLLECSADVAVRDTLEMAEDLVKIVDNGDNTLTVTNLTDQEIVTVRIFYKYYMEEEDAFVGGITYTAKISNLKANDSVVIAPSHFASSASTVVMVRTYDTDA